MLTVENSADGNCMYYAYSISLIYFLRAKNNPAMTADIFTKFKLKEDDKNSLRALLSKDSHIPFSSEDIHLIERVLARAARDLAAEQTRANFINKSLETPLYHAAIYGLEYCLKQSIASIDPALGRLIDNNFDRPDFTLAEIYRIDSIKPAMIEFWKTRSSTLIVQFHTQWVIKEKELKEKKHGDLSEQEIRQGKKNLLDEFLNKATIEFFRGEDNKYLNQYVNILQKNYEFAADDALYILHAAIQGEHQDRSTGKGVVWIYDNDITLHVYKSGTPQSGSSQKPDMILNNIGSGQGSHWNSRIPESIFVPTPPRPSPEKAPEAASVITPEAPKPAVVPEANVTAEAIKRALKAETDSAEAIKRALKAETDSADVAQRAIKAEVDAMAHQIAAAACKSATTAAEAKSSSLENISMMVLGGFIAAVGVAIVAIAFTLLNAATFGISGLITSTVGVYSALVGGGLFAAAYKNSHKTTTVEPEAKGSCLPI